MSLESASVVVDSDSLSQSASGAVTGIVYLALGEEAFPESDWSDFPLVILAWWASSVLDLLNGRSNSVECDFMDGPFSFELHQSSAEAWSLCTIERRAGERELSHPYSVDPGRFIQSLSLGIEAVLRSSLAFGASKDRERLSSLADRIRSRGAA